MPRTPRRRVAEGIYRDRYSLTAKVKVGARQVEKAFPPASSMKDLQRWRQQTRLRLMEESPRISRGSLEADVQVYLTRMKKRPASWPAKRSELRAWCTLYGDRARHLITGADIDHAIATWTARPRAAAAGAHRCASHLPGVRGGSRHPLSAGFSRSSTATPSTFARRSA